MQMSPLWLLYLIIPVLVGYFLAEYKSVILKLVRVQFFDERSVFEEDYETLIFIPSARGNFKQRAAIRNTWWGQVQSNSSLSEKLILKFIVGSHPCAVHPDDRLNQYSCEEWLVNLPEYRDEIQAIEEVENSEAEEESEKNYIYGVESLPFTVHFPIVLSKLGIYREYISDGASVRLLEASTQREIVSATFSKSSPGVAMGNFRYKAVEPYYLPKGFEGMIVSESLSTGSSHLFIRKWNRSKITKAYNSSGIIHFLEDDVLPDGHYEDIRKWNSFHLHVVSFIYSIHEYENLKKHVHSKASRSEMWKHNTSVELESLTQEIKQYKDIQLVDLVDVYRNVPLKFLKFAEWVREKVKFNFLLKTDDDCFLDVIRIINRLNTLKGATKTWLGRFRHNWLVEKYGKWAEKEYPSAYYPKFACGSGYILTSDIVHWVAKNAKYLKPYQGEDVSLGIWMAAIAPNYIDEPLWQCENDCLSNMYSLPELRQDEMQRIWSDLMSCGDPCGCN